MGILDSFLNTTEQLGRIQHNDLVNQQTLSNLEDLRRQRADADAVKKTLASLNTQQNQDFTQPQNLVEVPSATKEGVGLKELVPQKSSTPAPDNSDPQTIVNTNLALANEFETKAKAVDALNPELAKNFRAQGDALRTKVGPILAEIRKNKIEDINARTGILASINDEATLNAASQRLGSMYPGLFDAKTQDGTPLFPRGLNGRLLWTPEVQALKKQAEAQDLGAKERLIAENRAAELVVKQDEEKRKKLEYEETVRKNKAKEAGDREGNRIREKEVDARISDREDKADNRGAEKLRSEQTKSLKPIDETQQKITTAKQLLATSTPASDKQLQATLTNLFDKSRATNLLFRENANFGSIAGRVEGYIGRAFTGQFTDAQREQIRGMLDEFQSNVLTPSRDRIQSYYGDLAEKQGVNKDLVKTPNFYGDDNVPKPTTVKPVSAQAEADAFLSKIGKMK